jgi:hypothetical protein
MKKHVQKEEESKEEVSLEQTLTKSELAKLIDLWKELKALGVNSIGDLEVKIARLQ